MREGMGAIGGWRWGTLSMSEGSETATPRYGNAGAAPSLVVARVEVSA